MNGLTRGARVFALLDQTPLPVVVLDKGPEGWWVSFEDQTDERGYPLLRQIPARHLYPSKRMAEGL